MQLGLYEAAKILNCTVNSNEEEIKKAFKREARKHHPDLNGGKDKKFKKIKKAYDRMMRGIKENSSENIIREISFMINEFGLSNKEAKILIAEQEEEFGIKITFDFGDKNV